MRVRIQPNLQEQITFSRQMSKTSRLSIPFKFSLRNWKSSCVLTVVVPLLFRCFTPQNRAEIGFSYVGLVLSRVKQLSGWLRSTHKTKCVDLLGSERRKNMGKVSGKTHTKEQLDNWANQNNPNNKAYKANNNNHSNQLNPNHKTHQATHNADRRNR